MKNSEVYNEHEGRAAQTDDRFRHVMAITLDPASGYQDGIIRCIMSREGDVQVSGYVDRSELHKVWGDSLEHFKIGERVKIKNESEIIQELGGDDADFIGLEDPDIWVDEKTGLKHVYFTIPLRGKKTKGTTTHLGHAVGKDLDALEMTMPALMAHERGRAKEVSIAPVNRNGFRYNLFESSDRQHVDRYSTVAVAAAEDMGQPWKFGETVFHPAKRHIPWVGGHASPGPLLPDSFMEVGAGKRLGILNGREANQTVGDKTVFGIFSVGLFIYDYENGKIDWVSPEPFLQDSQAKIITFASQFIETGKGRGILYAHVDDSFVRAYTLNADAMKSLLSM